MESVVRPASFAAPSPATNRRHTAWTRTVAVIRIPRFHVLEAIHRKPTTPEDPFALFATETELEAKRRTR